MKKTLFLIGLVLLPLLTMAQVRKFKVFQDKYIYLKDTPAEKMDWQDVDILVVIDFAKSKITVFANHEQNYDIIEYGTEFKNKNGDNEIDCTCVDDEGIKCNMSLVVFHVSEDVRHKATLTVEYSNIAYFFRLQNDD